jgi:hypothetical protein
MGYANGQPGEVQASTSLSTRSGVPDSKILRDYSAKGRAGDVHGAGPDVIKDVQPSPTMACTLTEPVG